MNTGFFHVVETDYDNLSLLYLLQCSGPSTNVTYECTTEGKAIRIMSRTTNPDHELVTKYLDNAIKKLCGTKEDFIETNFLGETLVLF